MGKVKIDAATFTKRWGQGIMGASQKIEDGVNAVTEAPGAKAAKQADLWLSNVQKSKNKWAKNVAKVSLSDWKRSMIEKGVPALQNAIPLAEGKVQAAAQKLIPAINAGVDSLPPRGTTIEANMQRALHMAKHLNQVFSQ